LNNSLCQPHFQFQTIVATGAKNLDFHVSLLSRFDC
jgi:hypothetical protein